MIICHEMGSKVDTVENIDLDYAMVVLADHIATLEQRWSHITITPEMKRKYVADLLRSLAHE